MQITYNHLNLPIRVVNDQQTPSDSTDDQIIEWIYDAAGVKQSKTVKAGPTILSTQHYCAGLEYQNSELEAVYHANGRVYNTNSQDTSVTTLAWRYEYTLTDHLGNMRVTFYDDNGLAEVLQEEHYYPFGLRMHGSWLDGGVGKNEYGYNGNELNTDFGLNWNDYGARWYDAAVGRFWQVDPLAGPQASYSPYHYTYNNPLKFIDPTGMIGELPDAAQQQKNESERRLKMGRLVGGVARNANQQNPITVEGETKNFHYPQGNPQTNIDIQNIVKSISSYKIKDVPMHGEIIIDANILAFDNGNPLFIADEDIMDERKKALFREFKKLPKVIRDEIYKHISNEFSESNAKFRWSREHQRLGYLVRPLVDIITYNLEKTYNGLINGLKSENIQIRSVKFNLNVVPVISRHRLELYDGNGLNNKATASSRRHGSLLKIKFQGNHSYP